MAPWERGGRTISTLPWSLLRAAALTASPLDRGRLRSSPVLPRREGRWAWEEEGEDGDGGRLLLFRGGPVPSGAQLLMKQWRGAFRREAPTRPHRRRGVQVRSRRLIFPSCFFLALPYNATNFFASLTCRLDRCRLCCTEGSSPPCRPERLRRRQGSTPPWAPSCRPSPGGRGRTASEDRAGTS